MRRLTSTRRGPTRRAAPVGPDVASVADDAAIQPPSLAWSWLAVRDRLLASPRFQRWAVRFPATRWIARRRARALFDLCAGFVYSQILYACVKVRLFDLLAEGPQTVVVLARRLSMSEDAALRLLEGARALDLIETRHGDAYGLGTLGAALRGNPGVAAMISHHAALYADLADPVALLRGEKDQTSLGNYWPYATGDGPATLTAADTQAYTALMSESQAMIAAEVLDSYALGRHTCLMDVGGGDGTFLSLAARRAPALRLMLFDLPSVAERATIRFSDAGLVARASVHGGDFTRDELPSGADIVTLIRVIHDHDDDAALAILRAVRRALPDNGTVLIAEPMSDTRGAEPIGHAYFGFYLLAMGRGRPRSAAALTALLQAAGFGAVRRTATLTPMVTSVIVARPASI